METRGTAGTRYDLATIAIVAVLALVLVILHLAGFGFAGWLLPLVAGNVVGDGVALVISRRSRRPRLFLGFLILAWPALWVGVALVLGAEFIYPETMIGTLVLGFWLGVLQMALGGLGDLEATEGVSGRKEAFSRLMYRRPSLPRRLLAPLLIVLGVLMVDVGIGANTPVDVFQLLFGASCILSWGAELLPEALRNSRAGLRLVGFLGFVVSMLWMLANLLTGGIQLP